MKNIEKQFLSPVEMLKIAAEHAYCAEHLLAQNGELVGEHLTVDTLQPVISLIHMAFELTFKAFLIHEQGQIKPYKTLHELVELNENLGLSAEEVKLIRTLSRQQAFRKGITFNLWKNRQGLQVFCEQILTLYSRVHALMPIELQSNYQ